MSALALSHTRGVARPSGLSRVAIALGARLTRWGRRHAELSARRAVQHAELTREIDERRARLPIVLLSGRSLD
ncbi:hypothetical protein MN032_12760 [Agromyces atrinae]|uniref:hypothetical protein n=1 Tax=Agromyces atrinae TaxID=592376 RepID=UPI001F56B0EE|nr:hypothetical protein [Agromyces atrinae]MCI2958567.1 hypothetical protein [Agromyces atrinae]